MTDHRDGAVTTQGAVDPVEIGPRGTVIMTTVDQDTGVGVAFMEAGGTEEDMVAAVVVVATDSRAMAAAEDTMTSDKEVAATTVEISEAVGETIGRGREAMAVVAMANTSPMDSSSMGDTVTRVGMGAGIRATGRATRRLHSKAITSRATAHSSSSTPTTTRGTRAAATRR